MQSRENQWIVVLFKTRKLMMKTTEISMLSKISYPFYLKEMAIFAGRMDPLHIFQFREEKIYIVQDSKIWLKPVELCNGRTICRISFS